MLIRDGQDPFEPRDLGARRTFQFSLMKPLGAGASESGTRWKSQRINPHHETQRNHVARTTRVICEFDECRQPFVTTRPELAKYCSDRCRKRVSKRAQGVQPRRLVRMREIPPTPYQPIDASDDPRIQHEAVTL